MLTIIFFASVNEITKYVAGELSTTQEGLTLPRDTAAVSTELTYLQYIDQCS